MFLLKILKVHSLLWNYYFKQLQPLIFDICTFCICEYENSNNSGKRTPKPQVKVTIVSWYGKEKCELVVTALILYIWEAPWITNPMSCAFPHEEPRFDVWGPPCDFLLMCGEPLSLKKCDLSTHVWGSPLDYKPLDL